MKQIERYLPPKTAALLITPVNRRYFSGFASSDGYLVLTPSDRVLLVDGRYIEAARAQCKTLRVELLEKSDAPLRALLEKFGIQTLLLEDGITLAQYQSIKKAVAPIEARADAALMEWIWAARKIKAPQEADCMRRAQQIAQAALEKVRGDIKPGATQREIAAALDYQMKLCGAQDAAFETIVLSGARTSMPHGVPTDEKIKAGDFVTLDFGAVYQGYRSDMTRTLCIGSCTQEMARVYQTVLDAQTAALHCIKAGARCAEVDAAARKVIEQAGYGPYFTHSTGHGVGLDIHEQPVLSPRSSDRLEAGNVVTVEPGVYLPGRFGVRIEDMVLVTRDGCENFAKTDKTLH